MLKQIRKNIIEMLWHDYCKTTPQVKQIEEHLHNKGINHLALDHLAIIDLPGSHTGIKPLTEIFTSIGYQVQGKDYLPEKQNDFLWLAEEDSIGTPAADVLPQVVVADFRLDEMPEHVRSIIEKYSQHAQPAPITTIKNLLGSKRPEDHVSATTLITGYLTTRDWPAPTVAEFLAVRQFNELLAWVLASGRCPNHFTFSIHLLPEFSNLNNFHHFIETEVGLSLNRDGGVIKGGRETGIEQGSTIGTPQRFELADGTAELPTGFVEFVWRFTDKAQPELWDDYYTGFIANHANRVIQSLYT